MTKTLPYPDHKCLAALADMFGAARAAVEAYTSSKDDVGTSGFACVELLPEGVDRLSHCASSPFRRGGDGAWTIPAPCAGYQSIDAKEFVASAMVQALARHGIPATHYSWMD